VFLSNTITFN